MFDIGIPSLTNPQQPLSMAPLTALPAAELKRDHLFVQDQLWAGERAWLKHRAPQTLVVREFLNELEPLGAGICLLLAHWDFLFLRKWA